MVDHPATRLHRSRGTSHIHFGATARHECPTAADDAKGDGHLNTTDEVPAYGEIVVSLTKTGDTSPKSALAISRFSTAPGGKISYERGSIKVSSSVAEAITAGKSVVVIHGVDYNHDGKYDGATKSDLMPSLPTEVTDPPCVASSPWLPPAAQPPAPAVLLRPTTL